MLCDKILLIKRNKIEDQRGYFLKVIDGKEEFLPNHTGEVYITKANPKEMKGGHYHPIAKEWFTIIKGQCEVKLKDIVSSEEMVIKLDENDAKTLFVPNNIAHAFYNISETEEFILLAYSDELYQPSDTIMYSF
jgi:dTDP-4-dehydrorhamnose 3,5-epimerase-like enzyme